jgi:hypothetical protein
MSKNSQEVLDFTSSMIAFFLQAEVENLTIEERRLDEQTRLFCFSFCLCNIPTLLF